MSNESKFVDARFNRLAEVFEDQGKESPAGGSSLAVFIDGKPVVNLWQGFESPEKPWTHDTVSVIFSCTKGVMTLLIANLVAEGKLDIDEKVATIWPEFAAEGKSAVTFREVLQHRAGLSATRANLSHDQAISPRFVANLLAEQKPLFAPGSSNAYHALTFGFLVGEIIHRVTGVSSGEYLDSVAKRLPNANVSIGKSAEKFESIARLVSDGSFLPINAPEGSDLYWVEKAMSLGGAFPPDPTSPMGFNDASTLNAEVPGANGVSNAFGLAKTYSAAVCATDGIRIANDDVLRDFCQPQTGATNFWNEPLPFPTWGTGFMLPVAGFIDMPGADGFGHNGLGGQAAWASLEHRLSFAYTTSYLQGGIASLNNQAHLVTTLNEILAAD